MYTKFLDENNPVDKQIIKLVKNNELKIGIVELNDEKHE